MSYAIKKKKKKVPRLCFEIETSAFDTSEMAISVSPGRASLMTKIRESCQVYSRTKYYIYIRDENVCKINFDKGESSKLCGNYFCI